MRKSRAFIGAGLSLFLSAAAASAAPISIDTWYNFGFGKNGSPLVSGVGFGSGISPATSYAPDAPWTFTLLGAGQLFVTDFFRSGDIFELFNFGVSLGTTSTATKGSDCDNDISCAIADSDFSRGLFLLSAGTYSVTGIVTTSPYKGGAGAFRVSQQLQAPSEVPIPATLPLLAAGLGTLWVTSWRRKRKAATIAY